MSQSSAPKKIIFPLDDEAIRGLRAGDPVLITGTMLTARDAAHKRLFQLLDLENETPFTREFLIRLIFIYHPIDDIT